MSVGAGREWEIVLSRWHDAYRRDRLAWVVHTHPPVKILARQAAGRFVGVFDRTGPPDFVGVLAGGRAVVFDAKHTEKARFDLSAIDAHQARDLEAARDRGAAAFIALRLQGRGWILPWARLGPLFWDADGPRSLSAAAVAEIADPMDADGWLGAVAP